MANKNYGSDVDAKYVSDVEAAKILSVSPQTLRNWRCLQKGPPYTKLPGSIVRYRVQDLFNFMAAGRIDPEARRRSAK